jgi:hypothetical protein
MGTWPGAAHVKLAVAPVGVSNVPEGADHEYAMELGSAAAAVATRAMECPTVVSEGDAATLVHTAQLGAWASPASLPKGACGVRHCSVTVTFVVAPAAMLKVAAPLQDVPPSGDVADKLIA